MYQERNPARFYYEVYGLNVKSEIAIKEFVEKNQPGDEDVVEIILDDIPEEVQLEIEKRRSLGFTDEYIWLHIKNVATYVMYEGKKISIRPYEDADDQMLRLYLMCSCLGFIMLQRGHLAIHGSGVEIGEQAVIITGNRGAGKTTLATALRKAGHKILADDIVGIRFDEKPMACWAFPYQKVCEDAMDQLEYDKEKYPSFQGDNKTKYIVGIHQAFLKDLRPMQAIIEVCKSNVEQVTIQEIKGQQKLVCIIENIYRGEYIKQLTKLEPTYIKKCLELAKHIKFYKMLRPIEGSSIEDQMKQLNQILIG